MGSVKNELSVFDGEELVKCGEIVLSPKQNLFSLNCVHCKEKFSQFVVFARHIHIEHQLVGKVADQDQQHLQNLSVYTVEELLTDKETPALSNSSGAIEQVTEENVSSPNSDSEDTGIDSDEELEKEISKLLASIATSDSHSVNESEYSDDSGVDSKNITDQNQNQASLSDQSEGNRKQETKITDMHNLSDTSVQTTSTSNDITPIMKNSFEAKYFDVNQQLNVFQECGKILQREEKERNYVTLVTKESTDTNVNKCKEKPYARSSIKIQTKNENNMKNHLNTKNDTDTQVKMGIKLNDFKCANFLKEQEIDMNDDLEYVREAQEVMHASSARLPENFATLDVGDLEAKDASSTAKSKVLEGTEEPIVIVEVDDELAGIKFSKEEIDQIKAGIPQVPVYNFKEHTGIELEKPETHALSGYQMEYVVYNETNEQAALGEELRIQDDNCISEATDFTAPLDLSLNKSSSSSDLQSEEISDLPTTDDAACKITKDIITEVENLLAQQDSTFTDNSTPSFESNDFLVSDSIDNHQLPPFSKFFKNTANAMKISNRFLAQSTPKQKLVNVSNENKHTKTSSPLRPSAQLNMNANVADVVENVTHSNENPVLKKIIKYPSLKRALLRNEKENETKNRKIETDINDQINYKAENCVKKKDFKILSVEVLPPNATIADKLKLGGLQNLKLPKQAHHIGKWEPTTTATIEEDLIPYAKIKNTNAKQPVCTSHVAADSTSEKLMTSTNELNYTPEDTLNQLKLEQLVYEKPVIDLLLRNDFNTTDPLNSNSQLESIIEENSFTNDSMLSGASEEEMENYKLLRLLGLQIIIDPNAEDGRNLKKFETMRAQASLFAKIFAEFKYLWKVGRGIKSFEQLELDFNKLMQRTNEQYKIELTIAETKRIVNLIALWYMQSYQKCLIKKKPTEESVSYYLNLFTYLPKTARRIFYCEECPRYFFAQQKYIAHCAKHAEMPNSCPYCQTTYASRKELLLHTKTCISFTCIECGSKFENTSDLEYHLRNEHLWECETCGKICPTVLDLNWHEHQHPIICGLCNDLFDSAAELQKHRQTSFHLDYTCTICDVFLPTATQVKHHLTICNSDADEKGAYF